MSGRVTNAEDAVCGEAGIDRLAARLRASGLLPDEWATAFYRAPRDNFAPDVIWLPPPQSAPHARQRRCARADAPHRWERQVWSGDPVNIQLADASSADLDYAETGATSGISDARVVFRMLAELDAEPGMRCLEIGAGSGWNAALLAARLGDENVVTIEVDPELAKTARKNLRSVGLSPLVLAGDGALGHAALAPYDRVIATCAVRRLPHEWVQQTRPGGVIVAPFACTWADLTYIARLTVDRAGAAHGRFRWPVTFMIMRSQRLDYGDVAELIGDAAPTRRATALDPVAVSQQQVLALVMSAAVPGAELVYDEDRQTVLVGVWQAAPGAGSFAEVHGCDSENGPWTVDQWGPRRLWDEVESAFAVWESHGFPDADQFGLSVRSADDHRLWLGTPDGPSWPLPPLPDLPG